MIDSMKRGQKLVDQDSPVFLGWQISDTDVWEWLALAFQDYYKVADGILTLSQKVLHHEDDPTAYLKRTLHFHFSFLTEYPNFSKPLCNFITLFSFVFFFIFLITFFFPSYVFGIFFFHLWNHESPSLGLPCYLCNAQDFYLYKYYKFSFKNKYF